MISSTLIRNVSFALAALFACGLTVRAQEAGAGAGTAADEAALRENVRQLESGWNTKSGARFAKPFAVDADYVIINGGQLKGRDAIAKSHQRIFDTFYKESVISLSVRQIRFLRPDVAVVHVAGTNRTPQGTGTRETSAVITLVMTKEKGAWQIVAFQNTEVAAGPTR